MQKRQPNEGCTGVLIKCRQSIRTSWTGLHALISRGGGLAPLIRNWGVVLTRLNSAALSSVYTGSLIKKDIINKGINVKISNHWACALILDFFTSQDHTHNDPDLGLK